MLTDVSVGVVASEKLDSEGAWVEADEWTTHAGAMDELALRAERGCECEGGCECEYECGHDGVDAAEGAGPSEREEKCASRA